MKYPCCFSLSDVAFSSATLRSSPTRRINIFFHAGLTPNVDTLLVSNYTYDEIQDLLSSILFHTFLLFHFITVFFFSDGYINYSLCAFVSLSRHPSVSISVDPSVILSLSYSLIFLSSKEKKMFKMSNTCTSEFYKEVV